MPIETELLTRADEVLSKCGRPLPPGKGLSVVMLKKDFLVQYVLPNQTTVVITKEITGETTWTMRAVSIVASNPTGIDIQVQLPDGRFLINNQQHVAHIAGYGSGRYAFTEELDCPPETKIKVTIDSTFENPGSAQPISMLFEGAYKFYLKKPQTGPPLALASGQPRYLGHANQAIEGTAPWMFGVGPRTPKGFLDELYIYGSQLVTIPVVNPTTQTGIVQIDQSSNFEVRRLLFSITADATVTGGSVLARLRAGTGYALNDEPIDIGRYLNGATFAHDWEIQKGDTVFIDYVLVDNLGTGNFYVTAFLEGVKRFKIA